MKPLYVKKNGTVNKVSGVAMPNTFPANRVGYDNTTSELEATNTQDAIDEVVDIVADKVDKVSSATNGNLAGLDASGNLVDSGVSSSTLEAITNVYGSKNLLHNTATSQTINGVTFTVNSDGSVTINGTATAQTDFTLPVNLGAGNYIVNGIPAGIDTESIYYLAYRDNVWVAIKANETKQTVNTGITYFAIRVVANTTVSNLTFYPMIRDARISDSTYVPYAMTNVELTKNIETIANRDREFVYAQREQNITITFSGNAVTRVPVGLLIVCGQSGIIEPISFMFSGAGSYPTRESINDSMVYLSANGYNITGDIQCINIPAGIGYNWGYVIIKENGDKLKDITITVTYS